ncbi:MAG: M81 family metallopeptidase [Proteobacteria bacterium]|nr:M81 family metallopeptidase [Pseudomonadota bacterium]MBI3497502.1 M81 family metallopeptidase [Pseudomonadota bacterium]
MKHIAIARFGHEGNSFSPVEATLKDFQDGEWAVGEEVPRHYRGSNTEIGGAVKFLDIQPGWKPTWLRSTFASPSGPLAKGVYETILDEILDGLRARPWDAVYLAQHGALNAHGRPHADLDLLRAVRSVIGETPLGVTYDLHANVTQEQADLIDISVGYKCHPHTDMAECAEKCLKLLLRKVAGEIRPVARVAKTGTILPSINARTTDGPMASVAAFARAIEAKEGLLDVTPYHGYAYGDSQAAGASVLVFADGDAAKAESAARDVAAKMNEIRDALFVSLPSAEAGIARAIAAAKSGKGPVAVIDAADHPGAGAIGDTPEFFRALLAARPSVPAAFVFFADPTTVARAHEAGVGGRLEAKLGGRLTPLFGPPVPVVARVVTLTQGRFTNVGPVQNGLETNFGRTAVLEVDGIRVVVSETCRSVTDPAFFRLHDIDLAKLGVLAVKAKNQFRAAFRQVFCEMIDIDTPGPAALDFAAMPWRIADRTLYPLNRRAG